MGIQGVRNAPWSLRLHQQDPAFGTNESEGARTETSLPTEADDHRNTDRATPGPRDAPMKTPANPTRFSFNFTNVQRIAWTHGRHNDVLEETGKPAAFSVDDQEIASRFSSAVEPMMADLVDIAVAVHMADRLAVRTLEAPVNWSRNLRLRIGVRHPRNGTSRPFKSASPRFFGS